MNVSRNQFLATLALGTLAACGTEGGLSPQMRNTTAALSEAGQSALNEIAIINGDYTEASSSAECLALRTKVYSASKAYKLTDAWGGLTGTAEYKTYETDQDHFSGAGCRDGSASSSAACQELRQKVEADGDAIANTAQFKVVDADSSFRSIMDDFNKAKTIGCVK